MSRHRPVHIACVLLVLAACALGGCATPQNTAEAWLTNGRAGNAWTRLAPDRQIDLPASSVEAAVIALGGHEAVQLDPDTFARLVPGREWPSQSDRVPYLVRGVALDEGGGSLHVLESGDQLLVQYEGPMVRARAICSPVIVLLPAAPGELFVRISLFNG